MANLFVGSHGMPIGVTVSSADDPDPLIGAELTVWLAEPRGATHLVSVIVDSGTHFYYMIEPGVLSVPGTWTVKSRVVKNGRQTFGKTMFTVDRF
jgi:hypothetical protein